MTIERFLPYHSETAEYLCHVSDRYKYFYLANPKVASTTILRALQLAEVDGDKTRVPDADSIHRRELSPVLTIPRSHYAPEIILDTPEFFRFTYVRNPYTRALSGYLDKVVRDPEERARLLPTLGLPPNAEISFLEFLQAVHAVRDSWRDLHWMTQGRLVQSNNIRYHYIGRFETFSTSFPKLLERMRIDPSYFESAHRPYVTDAGRKLAQYLGSEEQQLILTIYESDFVIFGYGRDPAMAHV